MGEKAPTGAFSLFSLFILTSLGLYQRKEPASVGFPTINNREVQDAACGEAIRG
jgi:hypothetical protein